MSHRTVIRITIAAALAGLASPSAVRAQGIDEGVTIMDRSGFPFRLGESLEYEVRVQRLGRVGEGRMWVEGPVNVNGIAAWRLRFELEAGKGPIRGADRTSSWIDPLRFETLRFLKEERHPLSRSKEDVRIQPDSGRWSDLEGPSGELGHDDPLDELSFLYFIRTLPLDRDTTMRFERHFDRDRNPTVLTVSAGDTIKTPAGIFATRLVTMEVRDPKRYKGTGTIRIYVNDAECRVPVRIESRMPVFGATTLLLKGWSHPPGYPQAIVC
jgi:hypothetical protein